MAKPKKAARGGARKGAGRPAPEGRGRPVTVYLSPPQLAVLARHGATPQAGIRALIEADMSKPG